MSEYNQLPMYDEDGAEIDEEAYQKVAQIRGNCSIALEQIKEKMDVFYEELTGEASQGAEMALPVAKALVQADKFLTALPVPFDAAQLPQPPEDAGFRDKIACVAVEISLRAEAALQFLATVQIVNELMLAAKNIIMASRTLGQFSTILNDAPEEEEAVDELDEYGIGRAESPVAMPQPPVVLKAPSMPAPKPPEQRKEPEKEDVVVEQEVKEVKKELVIPPVKAIRAREGKTASNPGGITDTGKALQATLDMLSQDNGGLHLYEEDGCRWFDGCGFSNVAGFTVECGSYSLMSLPRPFYITDTEYFDMPYQHQFVGRDHWNFIACNEVAEAINDPCIISVKTVKRYPNNSGGDDLHMLAFVRNKRGQNFVQHVEKVKKGVTPLPLEFMKNFQKQQGQYGNYKFTHCENPALQTDIVQFEKRMHNTRFKFGVIYAQGNQGQVEEDMYGNPVGDDSFEMFLHLLGTKIDLKGWNKYKGGLDTQNGTMGEHSIYTDWHGLEIMFHVSTYLPLSKTSQQQVDRKRHIGNDITLIVYHTGEGEINPAVFRSKFNHVFFVVRPDYTLIDPETSEVVPRYRLSVAFRDEVKPWHPQLPRDYLFERDELFREFLLTKLVNAELSVLRSAQFVQRETATRSDLLSSIVKKHIDKK